MEDIMSPRHIIHTSVMAALLLSTGCATDLTQSSNEGPSAKPVGFVTQDQARHLAFAHRRQATEISELARRIELEASLLRRQFGPDHEESTRRLAQVRELLAAAEEADELARAYGRQVPHGQVQ
jgi:AraC-like DNA-binding protein